MNKKIRTTAVETLFEAIIRLETVDECFDFFEDLATINEILSFPEMTDILFFRSHHRPDRL